MGNAIVSAGAEIRDEILSLAGDVLDIEAEALELRDGTITDLAGEFKITLKDLLAKFAGEGYSLTARHRYSRPIPARSG
jgi:hypothetical protein